MTLDTETRGHLTIARLGGHVDTLHASDLESALMDLADGGAGRLLVDCTHLAYINSAGLRVFLLVAKRTQTLGGSCAFCGLSENVRLVFETIGFDRVLKVYDDCDAALAQLAAPAVAA
ncbi:MAG: STAS domain-containing protein [Roseimicrobium sp.]